MSAALSILVAVLGVSLLIVIHEAGHAGIARACGMRVERFSVGFGRVLWSVRRGETEYALSALPFGGYVRIAGMAHDEEAPAAPDPASYAAQPPWRRFLVIAAGPALNYLSAVVLAAALLATVGLEAPDPSARVGALVPGAPAEQAGLRPGDRIASVAGVPVETWETLVAQIQRHPGQEIRLEVVRGEGGDAERLLVPVTPRDDGGIGRVGFQPAPLLERVPFPGALAAGLRRTNAGFAAQLDGFAHAFAGLFSKAQRTGLSGPVGIAQDLFRGARAGTVRFLALLWTLSIALALLNVLPIPGLDGSRLVFLGYEMVTRRAVNPKVEAVIHTVGLLALLALMLGVTFFNDLPRWFHR